MDALTFAVTLLSDEHSHFSRAVRGLLTPTSVTEDGTVETAIFRAAGADSDIQVSKPHFIVFQHGRDKEAQWPDMDTVQEGTQGPYRDWEGDHTALVHVLWHAAHEGLTVQADSDAVARLILRSRWLRANRALDAAQTRGASA